MRQSAISSASSSTRWIEAMVASMLTTTPFLRPREACVPRPITLRSPSPVISATIATIFDVPMSRPTIRFLLSFTMRGSAPVRWLSCLARGTLDEARDAHREAVAIAQVHTCDRLARARQGRQRARIRADQAIEARVGVIAAQRDGEGAVAAFRADLPGAARREREAAHAQVERRQAPGPVAIARGDRA